MPQGTGREGRRGQLLGTLPDGKPGKGSGGLQGAGLSCSAAP